MIERDLELFFWAILKNSFRGFLVNFSSLYTSYEDVYLIWIKALS